MKTYDPFANMNLLQKLGLLAQNTATKGAALQPYLQQQQQAQQMQQVGDILAGNQIPAFAFDEQTPEQIRQAKQQQLAALGSPLGFDALLKLQQDEISPYQQAQLDLDRQRLAVNRDEAQARREEVAFNKQLVAQQKRDDKIQLYTEKLSKRIEDSGIADVIGSLENLDKILPEGDIEGVGILGGLKPMVALSEKGKEIQQELLTLRGALGKARSGATLSEEEVQRILAEIGSGVGSSEEQLRRGLKNARRAMLDKLKSIEGGYPKEALTLYEDYGGITSSRLNKIGSGNKAESGKGVSSVSQLSDDQLLKALSQ